MAKAKIPVCILICKAKDTMKKLLYLALIAISLAACSSPEKKAESLIKDCLKMSLLKPETYKPVKTILREANSPYDDIELLKEVKELKEVTEKLEMSEWWIPSEESGEKYEKAIVKFERMKTKKTKLLDDITSKLKKTPELVGYMAFHNFRVDDNAGNTSIVNIIAFFDKDMKRLTYFLEESEYEARQEYIKEEILLEE